MINEEINLQSRKKELKKEMADASLAYWTSGAQTPMERRTEMRAELADIDLRLHQLKTDRMLLKERAVDVRRNSLTSHLSSALEGLGRGDLVVAAKERALQDVKDAGLYDAYKDRWR